MIVMMLPKVRTLGTVEWQWGVGGTHRMLSGRCASGANLTFRKVRA